MSHLTARFITGPLILLRRSGHNAEQQAHGNIYNTPGVCVLGHAT